MIDQPYLLKPLIPRFLCFLLLFSTPLAAFETVMTIDTDNDELENSLTNVSAVLSAESEGVSNSQDILAAALSDYGRLVGALYERGYYGPVVSISIDGREASNIPPLAHLTSITRVEISISSGPAFNFGTLEISPLTADTSIPEAFQIGFPAETSTIRNAALAGVDAWRAVGHAKARVDQQNIVADHREAQLNVQLGIAPGPLVSFGDLNISGDSTVREARIRAIAGVPAGGVFDPVVLENAAARLRRAGAFSSVTLREAERLRLNETLDIELAFVDAKPRRFGFGAELHSTEGLEVSAYWLHRNLLGGAERFRIEAGVSGLGSEDDGLDYLLEATFTRPATFNVDTDLYVRGKLEQLDEPLYFSRQASVGVGLERIYSETFSAKAGVTLKYSDVDDDLGSRQFSHLLLPLEVSWDRRDSILNPTAGTYLHADIMPFLGHESESGGRIYLDGRAYAGIGEQDDIVFAGRLHFGNVIGPSISETPPDLLFYSGGSGTVRGQTYQSLAITSGLIETGGRSFLGLSGEARIRVTDTIGAVAFYDAGYIGANSWVDDTGGWHSGAGIGLRYQTGFGPIRLDIAAPIEGDATDGIQIYLGIGQAF